MSLIDEAAAVSSKPSQSRRWTMTVHMSNVTDLLWGNLGVLLPLPRGDDILAKAYMEKVRDVFKDPEWIIGGKYALDRLSFLVLGLEMCPKTKRWHLQGYLELEKKKSLRGVQKIFQGLLTGTHLEMAHHSGKINLQYCQKTDPNSVVHGQLMKQGQRTDLEEIKKLIDEGNPVDVLWDSYFSVMLQYRRGIQEYANLKRTREADVPTVLILWGPTGTGKTRLAYEIAREQYDEIPFNFLHTKFFEGYNGQRVALFDEFDGSTLSFGLFKQITDRYPIRVDVKGSSARWVPEIIIFTSNIDPRNWWMGERLPDNWFEQLQRRVTKITHYNTLLN